MQDKAPSGFPYRALAKGVGVILTLALLAWLVDRLGLGGLMDQGWIDAHVSRQGWQGVALFVTVGTLFTAIGWPRQVVAFLGGYAYGLGLGTLWALLASVLGCALAFYYARWLARGWVQRRFPERARRLDEFIHEHPFSMTLLIRLLPVGSNLVTNLAAGVSRLRSTPFLGGSAAGFLPQTLIFALAGSGVAVDPAWRIGLAVLLFVLSGVLGVRLYRRFRHGRDFDAMNGQAPDGPA